MSKCFGRRDVGVEAGILDGPCLEVDHDDLNLEVLNPSDVKHATSKMARESPDEPRAMKQHTTGGLKNVDADGAAWEAGKGAVVGASKVCQVKSMCIGP